MFHSAFHASQSTVVAVFMYFEPLSNLDAKLREEMQFQLRQIQRKVGTTTVMVTHAWPRRRG